MDEYSKDHEEKKEVKKDRIFLTIETTLERRYKLKMFSLKNGISIKELLEMFIDKLDDQ
jgi:hypothetical protein